MNRFIHCMAALLGLTIVAAGVAAQNFPEKNITLLHAYSPGSSSAVLLRALADAAAKTLGKKIVVEDKPGAGGALAPTLVHTTGKPDGYLLTQAGVSQLVLNPLFADVPYNVQKDFVPIGMIGSLVMALYVHNSVPATTLKGLTIGPHTWSVAAVTADGMRTVSATGSFRSVPSNDLSVPPPARLTAKAVVTTATGRASQEDGASSVCSSANR